jgi:hypothetical protein
MAICCAMMFGRFGTTVSTNILGVLLEKNCSETFYSFSGICVLCCIVAFVLPRPKK